MARPEKISIGISVHISSPTENLFTNGIRQNAIILRDTLKLIDFVEEVYYINLGKQKDYSQSPWQKYNDCIIEFEEALETVHVIIESCATVSEDRMPQAKERDIKIVSQVLGNEYYSFCEALLFKELPGSIISKSPGRNATWISPMLYETNKHLFESIYNAPSHVAPYIWSPQFIQEHVDQLGEKIPYRSKSGPKRISTFEPNLSLVKTSVFPMVILEKLHIKRPDVFERASVFCTDKIKDKKVFVKYASSLDIYKDKKMSFESRFPIVWSMVEHTDIVLSHQQDNGMNYLYFDAAWLGWPLVHNSHFFKNLGWYYSGFDADEAVEMLVKAAEWFDGDKEKEAYYLRHSRNVISEYLPQHPRNVDGYQRLLELLFL